MKLSVLIPYKSDNGPRDRIFDWVYERYERLLPDAELCVGQVEPFERASARNEAYSMATGDILLVADADTVFHVGQIRDAVRLAEMGAWVIPYGSHHYYNLTEAATEHVLQLSAVEIVHEPRDPQEWEHKLESWAGLLVMPREAWECVHGYDERFKGWSFEDNAVRCALDTLWGPHLRTNHYALHLWHPASLETTWQQPNFAGNRTLFQQYQRAMGDPSEMKRLVG